MTRCLDIIEDLAVYAGYRHCRLDGSTREFCLFYFDIFVVVLWLVQKINIKPSPTAMGERQLMIAEFNRPDSEVFLFLLSTRAGQPATNISLCISLLFYFC